MLLAGIRVVMITGDHLDIAKETARQLGLGDNILHADMLGTYDPQHGTDADEVHCTCPRSQQVSMMNKTLDCALTKAGWQVVGLVEQSDGFAGVFPEQKFQVLFASTQNHPVTSDQYY